MQHPTMFRTLPYIAVGMLVAGPSCRRAPAFDPRAPATSVSFTASSLESHYAVRAAFRGTVTREPGRLVVQVHEGQIRSSKPARNLQLRAGLGRRSSRGWEYEPHGPAIPLLDTIGRGQELYLEALRLTVPISDRLILEPHWLVFELTARDDQRVFSTFVCTVRDLFRAQRSDEPIPTGDAYVFWC